MLFGGETSGARLRLAREPVPYIPLDELTEPQPRAALAYWLDKRGNRAMPSPAQIDPAEIPRLLPYVTLIEVLDEDPPDYFYRIEGEAVRMAFGMKRAGLRLSALEDKIGAAYAGIYQRLERVRTTREPLAHSSMMTLLNYRLFSLQTVLLPLSADGMRVERILGCMGLTQAADRLIIG